ncbi:MAG: aldehyde dehydrogenase family protein [Candidatus Thorarchaeota archaeon]|jgi:aldehyde dehydrogenase (NAD+)
MSWWEFFKLYSSPFEKDPIDEWQRKKYENKLKEMKRMGLYVGRNYINGEWRKHSGDFGVISPVDESDLGTFPITEGNELCEAVDAANCAFKTWRKVSRIKRAEYFDELAQLMKRDFMKLVDVVCAETGKSSNEAVAEVNEALHSCQLASNLGRQACGKVLGSEISEKEIRVNRKPKGVVAVISPWNFPLAIGSFWCAATAIVEGNCVVLKPSELTPMTTQMAVELYHEAGFPPGVINLIHGMGKTGATLVRDNHVQTILFTGSAEVGKDIRTHCAATWHKSCSCEMGSKSAVIVFEDGNQELALQAAVASAFKLTGQRCVSSGRILIARSRYDEFCKSFAERVKTEVTAGGPSTNSFHGPLISRDQRDRVEEYNQLVRDDDSCEVLLDGHRIGDTGYFLSPHVYKTEWDNKRFLKEEVFGPHVALIPFDTVGDAIDIYNDTDYGLALGVITEDFRIMRRCEQECDTGMLYLNGGSIAAESHAEFGGVKKSGNGWKTAIGTVESTTEQISITTNYEEGISFPQGMK